MEYCNLLDIKQTLMVSMCTVVLSNKTSRFKPVYLDFDNINLD